MARRKGISTGTTAQRTINEAGHMRFNTSTNLLEYYDGTNFKSIDTPPSITSIAIDGRSAASTGKIDRTESANSGVGTIVIAGQLFDTTGATVTFIPEGGSGSTVTTQSISRDSTSQLTVTVTRSDFVEAGDPYQVKVTNGSELSATLDSAIDVNVAPAFSTAADTNLGTATAGAVTLSGSNTAVATDADGDSVTHTISAGSLPSGVSLNTNGTFSGAYTGSGSGNATFTVSATDGNYTVTRQFLMAYNDSYEVEYLVVAAGGGGGGDNGGGGGAGGYRTATGYSLTKSTQYTITVGSGGSGGRQQASTNGSDGGNSVFATITSTGGGGGLTQDQSGPGASGRPGGSGGGVGQGGSRTGGSGNTPSVSPPQGNNGGVSSGPANSRGGGGGGHSAAGQNGQSGANGAGGAGTANSITGSSVTYAGGGGGGADQNGSGNASGGSGGGGNGGNGQSETAQAPSGTDELGGGGGGGMQGNGAIGGDGGNGVVILKIPTAAYSGTTTGGPTVSTDGDYKILKYTSNGTYTA